MTHTEQWDIQDGQVRHQRALHADQSTAAVYAGHNSRQEPNGVLRITFGGYGECDALSIFITAEQARQIVAGLTSALD